MVCRLLKTDGRVVLLVGAEFRLLLMDCVRKLNDAHHNTVTETTDSSLMTHEATSCSHTVTRDHVLGSDPDRNISTGHAAVDDDNVTCTESERASTADSCGFGISESRGVWTTVLEHYVKLGETHAYICCFMKKNR